LSKRRITCARGARAVGGARAGAGERARAPGRRGRVRVRGWRGAHNGAALDRLVELRVELDLRQPVEAPPAGPALPAPRPLSRADRAPEAPLKMILFIFRRMGGGRALSQRPRVVLLSSLEDFLLDEKNPSGPGRPSRGAGQRATPASGTRNVPGRCMPGCGTPRCQPACLQGRRAGPHRIRHRPSRSPCRP